MNRLEMNSNGYNKRWESFGQDMKRYGPFSRHTRRLLHSQLTTISFSSLLDAGCGPGILLEEIQKKYPAVELTGLDFSESVLEIARLNVPNGKFFPCDLSQDKLDMTFDVVICSEVLEHIEDDLTAIKHLSDMTNKYLLVSTPQGKMRKFETKGVGHVRNYSIDDLTNKLSENNLKAINIIEWGFPFYSPLYRDFLDLIRAKGTGGSFGLTRKIISEFLYVLFKFNSSKRGDELIVLAEKLQ